MKAPDSVAIIGGGFSGALQAINLMRHDGPRAALIERRPQVGKGVAYSTSHPGHLLNVRASNMSAFPDSPDHFIRWLADRGWADGGLFVPRALYGEYLAELVAEARRRAPDRLEVVYGEAVRADLDHGARIHLRGGRVVTADNAVLAMGNLPPVVPDNLDLAAMGCHYIADPWSPDLPRGLNRDDHVVIIGTGLTMVDVVLLLDARGFNGSITAISRRGLLPRVQIDENPIGERLTDRPTGEVSELLKGLRHRSRLIGWRSAIDELRPFTQSIWQAATPFQQQRFLRHLRPWWDVHRHRLAPDVARRVASLQASGRLRIEAGRTLSFHSGRGGIEVTWRPRGAHEAKTLQASRIVNCTGPQSDVCRTTEPLLLDLLARGLAMPDPFGLGLSVDAQSRLLDRDGNATRFFALGPMTRGTFWEITAVPDIRVQTWNVARYISNAHWVGGEGL
ncbi:MAG: FAD/NAD(P)-binding protein [Novosphingobium sp.]